jgi:hypothetical protein
MKQPKRYDETHPLVSQRTGDPARGEWIPKALKPKAKKKGKR